MPAETTVTAADVQAFAEQHREQLTYGPAFNRGLRDLVADAARCARIGDEQAAAYWLGRARAWLDRCAQRAAAAAEGR
jgi:hypothetical protein